MKNLFTVDVEDWFCSHNLQERIKFNDWDKLEGRVVGNTHRLLTLLEKFKVEGTFFILGWVADRYPALVRDIASMGHEIASHGYSHQLITGMEPHTFREDVRSSINSIVASSGITPLGYRAPAFSITQKTVWAWGILQELGFDYDSSVYPFAYHPDYGIPSAPLTIYEPLKGLKEIPMSCCQKTGIRIPCSGGAYFRFFPYSLFRKLAKDVISSGRPFVFYLHPWELDTDSPRINLPLLRSIRHYGYQGNIERKLERLLEDFEFTSIGRMLETYKPNAHSFIS